MAEGGPKTCELVPTLFFNSGGDDKEAYRLMRESGVNCRFQGPILGWETPVVVWGFSEYRGLEGIRRFIVEYKGAEEAA